MKNEVIDPSIMTPEQEQLYLQGERESREEFLQYLYTFNHFLEEMLVDSEEEWRLRL